MKYVERITSHGLCLGCGLCEAVLGKNVCQMKLTDEGFYAPSFLQKVTVKQDALVRETCPAIHVEAVESSGSWGKIERVVEAWSTDKNVRHKAASGGAVTALALYLLDSHIVNGILQVGVCKENYLHNELHVSRSREEILQNAQSRYAPALVFPRILDILQSSEETYAFIGKPCDIAGLKNLLRVYPQYQDRIKYCISIFCAGMPSYNATIKAWQQSGHTDVPVALQYRGNGWPGNFKADFQDGTSYQLTYNESWGKILGRQLGFRCKICPDGIGMLADVAVGDSWHTKDGYPDFTETEGRSFCMVRTKCGSDLLSQASAEGYIETNSLDIRKIKEQQPYQYNRRKLEGWRLLPVQLLTRGLLNFKGLSIIRLALTANPIEGFKNMLGTYNRMKRNGK